MYINNPYELTFLYIYFLQILESLLENLWDNKGPYKEMICCQFLNFESFDYTNRRAIIRALIDRAIIANNNITFFIKPDPKTLTQFIAPKFINQMAEPMNFVQTDGAIIIKRDIVFTKGKQLTKYNTNHRGLMTMTENNHLIVRAFATAWQWRQVYEEYGSIETIMRDKKTSDRTAQRYLNLAYMDPRRVNEIMSGKYKYTIEELFRIAANANPILKA